MTPFEDVMARRLDPASRAPLAVALSGGGDSLALLHLTVDWARPAGRPVLALTVDHGLTPQSPRWTAEAGVKAVALGADWRGLTWEGPKPATGLQAKARAARHALLAEAAREAGAKVLLMGHTRDDVLEGDLMRAADTPGLGRLRDWSPSPAWPEGRGVFVLRPLLAVSRNALRDDLSMRGADWFEDPANADSRFARVRARIALNTAHPGGSRDPETAARALSEDPDLKWVSAAAEAKTWVPASAGMSDVSWSPGGALVPRASISAANLPPLLLSVSGRTTPPRSAEVERLMQAIHDSLVATLAGCRVDARGEMVRVARATPRRGEVERPHEPVQWMRYRFEAACGLYPDETSIPMVA